MQLAKYKDFDSFQEALTEPERVLVVRVRELLQVNFPELKEKFAYGVPYYWGYSRICYLYPASFPYSGITEGVSMGFARGYLLSNEQGLLEMGMRKEVGTLLLRVPSDIREAPLLELLHEAVLLDAAIFQEKKRL